MGRMAKALAGQKNGITPQRQKAGKKLTMQQSGSWKQGAIKKNKSC